MSTNLTTWYPEVLAKVPGVPPPTALAAILEGARKFCERTHIWIETLPEIDIVADTNTYALTKSGAELIMVVNAKYKQAKSDGTESDDDQYYTLAPASEETLDRLLSGSWEWRETTSPTEYYISDYSEPESWVLSFTEIPTEASTDGLRVKVAVKPDNSATTINDLFWSNHKDAISYKACAILFSQTATPWGNIQLALSFNELFNSECTKASMFRRKGGTNRDMRFVYPKFV